MSTKVTSGSDSANPSGHRPRFIGIGAGKSGTTWLADMLRQHPRLFLPEQKELHYFNDLRYELRSEPNPSAAQPLDWYLSFFADASDDQICGEFSTPYLWNQTAATRIHAFDPAMRLMAVLREPVQRLFAVYLFGAQRGHFRPHQTFEETLEMFPHMIERSMYAMCLSRYFDLFPADQIHVALHSDVRADPANEVQRVHEFIGVEPMLPEELDREVNVTGKPVHPRVTRVLWKVRNRLLESRAEPAIALATRLGGQRAYRHLQRSERFPAPPKMLPDTESRLREALTPDILKLEVMLHLDLSAWRGSS